MQTSLKSAEYARLVATLVAVRHGSGIRQQALARNLAGRSLLLPNTKAASAPSMSLNLLQLPALLILIQSSCSGILWQAGQGWAQELTASRTRFLANHGKNPRKPPANPAQS